MRFNLRNRTQSPPTDGQAAFTLLELLISIAIMSMIALVLYQIVAKTFELREKLAADGDFYNGIRLAIGVLDRDVTLLYSPILMLPEPAASPLPGAAPGQSAGSIPQPLLQPLSPEELTAAMGNDPGRLTSHFWMEAVHKSGIRPSRFQGSESKMSLVSVSNVRVYKESLESDFAKVEYFLEDDRSPGAEPGTRILVKKLTPNAFEDEEGGLNPRQKLWRTYPLLSGIKNLVFRYYRKERDEWRTSWDSDSSDSKYRYPDIVEVELEVVGPTRLRFEGKYHMKPETFLRGVQPSG